MPTIQNPGGVLLLPAANGRRPTSYVLEAARSLVVER
jgi:hypothetical protein